MKILFADIDGVLNTSHYWGDMFSLSPDLCENLAGILHTTGARLVISSDWRLGFNRVGPSSEFQRQLSHCSPQYFKFIISRLHGHTGTDGTREDQILEYVDIVKPEKFVALDDRMELYPNFPEWLVLTNPDTGLTLEAASAAISKLR